MGRDRKRFLVQRESLGKVSKARVGEAMTADVLTVTEQTSVQELRDLFKKYDFNAFPVVKGQELVGIVTKLDFMRIFSLGLHLSVPRFRDFFATKVGDVMRAAVITVEPEDTLQLAVDYMVEFGLRSLPVVKGKRLVGIVSREDVMNHLFLAYEQS